MQEPVVLPKVRVETFVTAHDAHAQGHQNYVLDFPPQHVVLIRYYDAFAALAE
jgi:hypothetical protein